MLITTPERKRSNILKYFSKDIYISLLEIIKIPEANNNAKGVLIRNMLKEKGIESITRLGTGTNRLGLQLDGYVVKIGLDDDGQIDNRREMLYSKKFYPDVIKVYECIPNGLIEMCEYITFFEGSSWQDHVDEMREILKRITDAGYLIGDVGISSKNYANWGERDDGSVCILDFAYIYDVKYKVFECNCGVDAQLRFDQNYNDLICPVCGKKYTFPELRRRITKAQQEAEIGDIRRLGYNLTEPFQKVVKNPEFEPKEPKKEKKKRNEVDELIHKFFNGELDQKPEDCGYNKKGEVKR